MKKLVIAAVALCAAVATQAASVDWNSGSKFFVDADGNKTTLASGTSIALIVLSDNTGWAAGTWEAAAGSVTELATASIGTGKNAGKITGSQYKFSYGDQPFADGSVLAVVFKDASGKYDQLVYQASGAAMTDTMTVAGLAAAENIWAETFSFATGGNVMAPETSDVPEPTSGLLVLLGVAGLALRRRA